MIEQKDTFFKPTEKKTQVTIVATMAQTFWQIFIEKTRDDGTKGQTPYRDFDKKLPDGAAPAIGEFGQSKWKSVWLYLVYNHAENRLQVWEVTQNGIKEAISAIVKEVGEAKQKITSVTLIVQKVVGKDKKVSYTVYPMEDKVGILYTPIEPHIMDFVAYQKELGNIELSKMLSGEYPIQGDAMQPIYDLSKVDITFATFAAETDFAKAKAMAAKLLERGDFTEDGVDYSSEEVKRLLYKKAEG